MRFFILLVLCLSLYARDFSVATYNVDNLFDIKKSGSEYPVYEPFGASGWNNAMLTKKINNLKKVILEVDADILALQEVESKEVLKRLNLSLGNRKYPYMYIPLSSSTVKNALLSRFPIKKTQAYSVSKRFRDIHEVTLQIDKNPLLLYLNHWPSYKNKNIRMDYAKKMLKIVQGKKHYIITGDINSPFIQRKNGWGKASELLKAAGYNLWHEEPYKRRYSHSFFGRKSAIDHIIISQDFLDQGAIRYIPHSFGQLAPAFAVDKKANPIRWQISKKGKGVHLGKGYSDHLPIKARFSTKPVPDIKLQKVMVKELFDKGNKRVDLLLEDVMVVDKKYFGVMLEDTNQDKIFFYRPPHEYELGKIYTIHVKELGTYKEKKEITAGVIAP